jgi:hypothetical protein
MMLPALHCNALDDHVLTDKIDDIAYWYHYDGIVLTWMLGTLSIELQEIICEPSETAWQAWLAIKTQFLDNQGPSAPAWRTLIPAAPDTSSSDTFVAGHTSHFHDHLGVPS